MSRFNAAEAILARSAEAAIAGRTALICGAERVSYAQLAARVGQSANAFLGLGVGRGDRVALLVDDSPDYVAAILGLMQLGAVAIPLNPKLKPDDYGHVMAAASAVLLVLGDAYRAVVAGIDADHVIADTAFSACVDAAPAAAPVAATDAGDEAFWLFSSGTTGRPKGIVHSHANAAHASKILREVLTIDETAVILASSKLFFAMALDNVLFGPLARGATTVIQPGVPDPVLVARQVAELAPTVLFTVPSFYRRLLELDAEALAPFAALPYPMAGGERIPNDLARRWRDAVGTELLGIHGMSESFTNVFAAGPGTVPEGSVGRALDGVACRVLDRVSGAEVVPGETGVLWIRHPSLALRYSDPQATARNFVDGWFCTHDLFRVDGDGFWFHEGRDDELLKVAGQWVKPGEVEDAVAGDPVGEAACVVVPDADGFERLALFVVSDDPEAALAAAAARAEAALPRHARPRWIRAVEALPRTTTGKLQRFVLRARLLEERDG